MLEFGFYEGNSDLQPEALGKIIDMGDTAAKE